MYKSIYEYLTKAGYKVIGDQTNSLANIKTWKAWYQGDVDTFHHYKVYTGKSSKKNTRLSLNMAMIVARKWADLLINERVNFSCKNKHNEDVLNKLIDQVHFYVRGNNLVELAFAEGGGFLIQYWDETIKEVRQKYISQEYMYPLGYNSGELTEAAFASTEVIKGKTYWYVEIHHKDQNTGCYIVTNQILEKEKEGDGYLEVSEAFYAENGIQNEWITQSKSPLFQMIRPNVADRYSFDNPYGTSIFSGAIDNLKAIDVIFDSYVKEFILGRKRIFVKNGVANFNVDETGETIKVFDPNDEVFYSLPGDSDETKDQIKEVNMDLRVIPHDTALQTQLNQLSISTGLGADGLKWNKAGVTTATQVVSENNDMFRSMQKHENLLRDSIIKMAKGLLYVQYECGGDKKIVLDDEITVDFDDSIIENKDSIKSQALIELNAGIISKRQYYMDVYGMTSGQAEKFDQQMTEEIAQEKKAAMEAEPEEPQAEETPVTKTKKVEEQKEAGVK